MTAISDAVVIGVVLGLVFAAVSYYLYSRQTQLERKIGLMENILLELKVTTEQTLLSSTEDHMHTEEPQLQMQAQAHEQHQEPPQEHHQPVPVEETREIVVEGTREQAPRTSPVTTNYESMTYKELQQIARQRGILGVRTMSKAQVIEALKNNDNPSSSSSAASTTIPLSSWTSTPIDELASAQDGTNSILATLDLDSEPDHARTSAPEASLVGSE
jgi:predicted transcriptional regulator